MTEAPAIVLPTLLPVDCPSEFQLRVRERDRARAATPRDVDATSPRS